MKNSPLLELKKLEKDLLYIVKKFNLKHIKIIIKLIDFEKSIIFNSEALHFYQMKIKFEDLKKWNDGLITYDDLSFSRRLLIKQSKNGFSILLVRLLRARGREKIYNYIFNDLVINGKFTKNSNFWICPHQQYLISRDCIDTDNEYISCPAHGWRFNTNDGKCILGDTNMKLRDSS